MRVSLLRGKFSPDGKTEFNGLIALCHLCKNDSSLTVDSMSRKIDSHRKKGEKILIAPYTGLYPKNESMNFDEANNRFELLASKIKDTTLLPLKYSEIHIDVVPPDGYVGFLEC